MRAGTRSDRDRQSRSADQTSREYGDIDNASGDVLRLFARLLARQAARECFEEAISRRDNNCDRKEQHP
jgi:hypothetical protein